MKKWLFLLVAIGLFLAVLWYVNGTPDLPVIAAQDDGFIKWVDFDIPVKALQKAGQADIDTWMSEHHVKWTESLACTAVKYGGKWSNYKAKDLDNVIAELKKG